MPFGGYAVPLPAAALAKSGAARRMQLPAPRRADRMTTAAGPVPGPGILDIAPYVGGEAKIAGVERPIRLASNESALGPSPKAIAAYRALAGEIHRYPDGSAEELREALGRASRARSGADRLRRRLGRADHAAAARLCRARETRCSTAATAS